MTTTTSNCCADCGVEGASLKTCKSCLETKYCDATCQRNHWPTHKAACKQRAAELRDEALFKDPPAKEDCPICFLPMPAKLICCASLPPATILSVPIYDFATADQVLADEDMEQYFPCCGKTICKGCIYSFRKSGNDDKCPFCHSDRADITDKEAVEEIMKRAEANEPVAMGMLGNHYEHGLRGLQQDCAKAMELYARAAKLGWGKLHSLMADKYYEGGDLKKTKFQLEAGAMAGHEVARFNLGNFEVRHGNFEQAVKHWTIGASAGCYRSMHKLRYSFERGAVSRESMDSTLAAYNVSCAKMRSKARDAFINAILEIN